MAKDVKFNIKLSVDGKDQLVNASVNAKKFAESLALAQTQGKNLHDKLFDYAQATVYFQNLTLGIQQISGAMGQLVADANAAAEAETKLATVMRQRMNATDADVEKIKELAAEQQKLGIIEDDTQIAGAQQIATFLTQGGSIEALLPAMNNLLAQQKGMSATSQDAVNIANLMGKAMQGQTAALRRVGITFDEAQEKALKYGTEEQRAAMLAQIITDNVGQMNAELAKTDAGKAKQMSNAIGDIKEQVGALFAEFQPAISAAGELGMAIMAFGTLRQGVVGAYAAVSSFAKGINIASVATATWRTVSISAVAITRLLKAAFTGATIGATTLKVAFKALLIIPGNALCLGL